MICYGSDGQENSSRRASFSFLNFAFEPENTEGEGANRGFATFLPTVDGGSVGEVGRSMET